MKVVYHWPSASEDELPVVTTQSEPIEIGPFTLVLEEYDNDDA